MLLVKIEFTSEQVSLGTITMPIAQILSLEALMNKIFDKGYSVGDLALSTDEGFSISLDTEEWHTVYSVLKLIADSNIKELVECK
jgi:hypothetical protein